MIHVFNLKLIYLFLLTRDKLNRTSVSLQTANIHCFESKIY